jgi:hypothetical protein
MSGTHIYINKESILKLELIDAVLPSLLNIKADHWHHIYEIYCDNRKLGRGLYANNYFTCERRQILIIEEYSKSILNKENIKMDEDVIKNLRIFDFRKNKIGRFSKLTGGSFLMQELVENKFIFSKKYPDKTVGFDIDISKISLEDIE